MLIPINLPAGLKRAGTVYQSKGRYFDANLVRWFEGSMRPVGGWARVVKTDGTDVDVSGVPRAAHAWRAEAGLRTWLAIGTNTGIYVFSAGVLTDITDGDTTGGSGSTSGNGPYGVGLYGIGPFSTAGAGGSGDPLVVDESATWTLDNFGDFLLGVLSSDGKLRLWQGDIAENMETIPEAPVDNRALVVTPERFVFVLGAGGNPRKVQWPSQETLDDWDPTEENTAGDHELTTNGRLMAGRRTTRETLIWTDTDLNAAIYIGGSLIYSFEPRGENCGLIAPNAAGIVGDGAMWWSEQGFFRYDGAVRKIECEVFDYIFTRLNFAQKLKITAIPLAKFGEMTWYYPSINSEENDSYVTYNWLEETWYFGAIERTAGTANGVFTYPILCDASGFVYEHERGSVREGVVYADTGPLELGDGNNTYMIKHLYPDEHTAGEIEAYIYSALFPNGEETEHGPFQMGLPTAVRITARQLRFRFREKTAGTDWRVGNFRAVVELAGER